MFHAPHGGLPRRSVLVKRARNSSIASTSQGSTAAASWASSLYDDNAFDDNMDLTAPCRPRRHKTIRFDMHATRIIEFEKVPPAERRYVWYDPHEEAEMARLAAPRSIPRRIYDWCVHILSMSEGDAQFGGGGATTTTDAASSWKCCLLCRAKDEFYNTPKRLSVERRRQNRILQENQGVMRRALVMMGFIVLLVGNAARQPSSSLPGVAEDPVINTTAGQAL